MGYDRIQYNKNLYIPRKEEKKVREKLQSAKAGDIFLIQGPPGIGKSWLIRHILFKDIQRFSVFLDVLNEEGNQKYYEGSQYSLREKDIVARTLVYRMLQKMLQELRRLSNIQNQAQRDNREDIYTLRARIKPLLREFPFPLYMVVDHVTEIPQEVRDTINRFLLTPLLEAKHILVLVGRSEPYFGYPIAIPEERVVTINSLFDDDHLKAFLLKNHKIVSERAQKVLTWAEGHPLAASVLARAWKKRHSERPEDYQQEFKEILQEILHVLRPDPEVYIELLHLLSWGKPANKTQARWSAPWHPQWIKKSVAPENRRAVLSRMRDLTQHAFCQRDEERPFYRLFIPNFFFIATLMWLRCDSSKQIYNGLEKMLTEEQRKQFDTLPELKQGIERRKQEWTKLCPETP